MNEKVKKILEHYFSEELGVGASDDIAEEICSIVRQEMVGEIQYVGLRTEPKYQGQMVISGREWQQLKRKWGILPTKPKKPFSLGSVDETGDNRG